MATKKVFVSGCFDLLHAGHVEFLRRAAGYGELYVSVAQDCLIRKLKGKTPVYGERERRFIVESLECVHQASIASGTERVDFLQEMAEVGPDLFIVNSDGDCQAKRDHCERHGIEYLVLDRTPAAGMPERSSTEIAARTSIPYRIDLAGAWLDQPWLSKLSPGPVVTLSLEPTHAFSLRAGMATSTRARAMRLWGNEIPAGDPEEQARMLFCFENPPGTPEVSGSQDALGMVLPGLNRLHYNGQHWPERIDSVLDEDVLSWLDDHLRLVFLYPRPNGFSVLEQRHASASQASTLARYTNQVWESILARDLERMGHYMSATFHLQTSILPAMGGPRIEAEIDKYLDRVHGVKISGAGGGGYLVVATDQPIEGSIRLTTRRETRFSRTAEEKPLKRAA